MSEVKKNFLEAADMQGILSLLVTAGLLGLLAFAMTKAGTLSETVTLINILAPLAALVLGFYFGKKAAE